MEIKNFQKIKAGALKVKFLNLVLCQPILRKNKEEDYTKWQIFLSGFAIQLRKS